jgi:hypothetical protein
MIQDQLLISHEWTQYWESKQPQSTQASSATLFNPDNARRDPDDQPKKLRVVSSRR